MFESISPAPPDAILGLTEAYKKDTSDRKINLGVGVYQDASGVTPVLDCVRTAEDRVLASGIGKSYLPISGAPEYARCVQDLLFGEGHEVIENGLAATAHTPGGTGALRVGADLLKVFLPDASVWASSPTWANHKGIFAAAGFEVRDYRYYDAASHGLDFEGMREALSQVPAGDIVLLHVCCHNPTGVDLSPDQWADIAALAAGQKWIPFLDFAYQGFGESVEADRAAVLAMREAGVEFLVASSFSKNFGLYQDRTGALTCVGTEKDQVQAVFSHLKKVVRVNYSNPPAHGGHIVTTVMADAGLKAGWLEELAAMRDRIKDMRSALVAGLGARGVTADFSFIEQQRGMFSFSGLTDPQVDFLREKRSIYVVKGGRINVAGITPGNLDYLCDAMAEAMGQGVE